MSALKSKSAHDSVNQELISSDTARELRYRAGLSLRPTESLMDDYIEHRKYARVAIDAWKFRYPVREVTQEQFNEMMKAGDVVFNG